MTNAMMLLVRILIAVFAAATIAVRLLARPVMDFAREGLPWLGRRPAARQEGRSLEFDSIPVRVQQHELGVRFRAEDVAAATRFLAWPRKKR